MRQRLFALLMVVIVLGLQQPVRAEEPEIRVVHFVEEANWPPFTQDRFGRADQGLSLALMQAIFSRLGIEVEIELLPQERMLHTLKSGSRDGATVISENEERMAYLDFSEPLLAKRGYVYYRRDRHQPVAWEDFADLRGLRIGIVAGHNYGDEFEKAVAEHGLTVVAVSREEQLFAMLMAARIDCLLSIDLTANYYLQNPAWQGKVSHAARSYYNRDYHLAFSKKSEARWLLPRVNEVIRQLRSDGTIDRLLASYRFE